MNKLNQNINNTDRVVQIALLVIIGLWLGFTLMTSIWPNSIGNLETKGMQAEAMNLKELGDQVLLEKNYKLAAGQYIEAVRLDPKNNPALTNLSICYTQLGLFDKAIICLQGVLKNNLTKKYLAYYNIGEVFFKQGNFDKAQMYFEKSANLDPFPMESYLYLARTFKEKKEWETALKTFQICLQNIPDLESSYKGTLLELQYEFNGNPKDSLDVLKIINDYEGGELILDHFDPSVFNYQKDNQVKISNIYNDIGFVYAQMGDYTKAIENFNYALKLFPASTSASNNLKYLKAQEKK